MSGWGTIPERAFLRWNSSASRVTHLAVVSSSAYFGSSFPFGQVHVVLSIRLGGAVHVYPMIAIC